MTEGRDNVIAITTRLNEAPPIEVRRGGWDDCGHKHTEIDDKLRTVSCRDCGEERLDPLEVLIHLARTWASWHREAEQLRTLNAEYQTNRREQWERSRDRHLNANPDHRLTFDPMRGGWDSRVDRSCRQCRSLEGRYDRRWQPRRAPEPPPGKLLSGEPA